jgi:hypothetical protein
LGCALLAVEVVQCLRSFTPSSNAGEIWYGHLAKRWKQAKKKKDPAVIGAAYTDESIPNLSSIVLYLEQGGQTALLTGDARGDRILSGLRANGALTGAEPLHVSLLKLPHHGSDRNVERDFFELIHADHYVISADGIAHHHPNENVLTWLVESRKVDDDYTIHLTNKIDFALQALAVLSTGRAFSVEVRSEAQSTVVIDLDS